SRDDTISKRAPATATVSTEAKLRTAARSGWDWQGRRAARRLQEGMTIQTILVKVSAMKGDFVKVRFSPYFAFKEAFPCGSFVPTGRAEMFHMVSLCECKRTEFSD